jgi:2,4-dienoyl-CoA reductase-like NADH-dependent reductase (Old Yellow Enzyme family)
MPSTSKKQHNFMEAIAHNKGFAKKVGVPQSVGQDFSKADKGKTFKKGGEMKKADLTQDKKMIKRAVGMHDKQAHKGEHTDLSKLKKGGNVKKMAAGGMPDPRMAAMMAKKKAAMMGGTTRPAMAGPAPTMPMKKGGSTKKMAGGGMTSMGKVKTNPGNINGVASKGLTKGKMVKMSSGGSGKKYC